MFEEERLEEEIEAIEKDIDKMQEGGEKQEALGFIKTIRKMHEARNNMFKPRAKS